MKPFQRNQFFVLPSVQGALLLHTALHWVVCILSLFTGALLWSYFMGPHGTLVEHATFLWQNYHAGLIAMLIAFPILIIDMLWLSNRFAGPMVRLQNSLRRLAAGDQTVKPLDFRGHDLWEELANDFNQVLEKMNPSKREQ